MKEAKENEKKRIRRLKEKEWEERREEFLKKIKPVVDKIVKAFCEVTGSQITHDRAYGFKGRDRVYRFKWIIILPTKTTKRRKLIYIRTSLGCEDPLFLSVWGTVEPINPEGHHDYTISPYNIYGKTRIYEDRIYEDRISENSLATALLEVREKLLKFKIKKS